MGSAPPRDKLSIRPCMECVYAIIRSAHAQYAVEIHSVSELSAAVTREDTLNILKQASRVP